ncbi:MAG: symmetrical bis(5'-nucleosyl)-tetraphosphatase, partial [Betaproteobacteria bacterium]
MSTYAIGDIQGCFQALQLLLRNIGFNPTRDRLWLVGDLVNRGPDSLAVLRWMKELGNSAVTVLGNHDLHLLAVAYGFVKPHRKDTIEQVLAAPDRDELCDWLRHQRLFHAEEDYALVHAGLL